MKPTNLFLAAALGMVPIVASAQMTPETAPVTAGSAKTIEKVWKPGVRWIKQKPGELERLDGTTITIKREPGRTLAGDYVLYEDNEFLYGVPSIEQARKDAEARARYLVELGKLPRTVVDQNAEEDPGMVKGVEPMGHGR